MNNVNTDLKLKHFIKCKYIYLLKISEYILGSGVLYFAILIINYNIFMK